MEEELIYELVDCIINNQDKIKELNNKIQSPSENEIYKKEIQYKHLLSSNIRKIDKYKNEKKNNEKKFQDFANNFYIKIEKIDNEISAISEKLIDFQKNNKNEELYKISYEKLKNIILKKEDKENLNIMKNKINKMNEKYKTVVENMEIIEQEKNKLKEEKLMLEEEKEGIDKKIVDYISLKESYDEMAKQYLKRYIFENMNLDYKTELLNEKNEELILNDDMENKNIIVEYHELNIIDLNKFSKEISNQIIYLINHYTKISKIDNNDILNINSYENMIRSNQNKDLADTIENNNNLLYHSIVNKAKIYYNKQEINSLISILSSKIEKKFIDYLVSSNNYKEKEDYIDNIDNLFSLVNDLIKSFVNIYFPSFINKNKDNSNLIIYFIKSFLKSFYYQKIISDDLLFLNKDYKKTKNKIEKKLNELENKYKDINKEKEECFLILKKYEEKMKYLNDNINNYIAQELTPEEKEYINLNQRLNELKTEKKKLKYDFIEYENIINYNAEKIKYKTEDLKEKNKLLRKNILTCQEEIKLKNHQIKLEIEKLEKSIKDKFNVIKGQISVYKKKYGDNMELYNRFVERINESLKQDDGEIKKENKNVNKKDSFNSNRNSLYNTQSTFYKSNEKQQQRTYFYSPDKIQNDNYDKKIYFY